MLHFSHYDQVILAALEGSGVAIGKRPHLTRQLKDGLLHAPFGDDCMATLGSFFIVCAPGAAERAPVAAFVSWLRGQMHAEEKPAVPARTGRRPRPPGGRLP